MTNRNRFIAWVHLCSLMFSLAVLCTWTGCSRGLLSKRSPAEKSWICDNGADEAMKKRDYETAVHLHERFLDKKPENGLALYHLGYAHGQLGDHLKEVYYYEKAVSVGFEKNSIFYNMGMAYGELNNTEKSISAFKKALEIDTDNADNHFGLAMAYYQRGSSDRQAEKEFLKAVKIDPGHVDARLYLSILYADMSEMQKANAQLHKILQIDPTNARALKFLERIEQE